MSDNETEVKPKAKAVPKTKMILNHPRMFMMNRETGIMEKIPVGAEVELAGDKVAVQNRVKSRTFSEKVSKKFSAGSK